MEISPLMTPVVMASNLSYSKTELAAAQHVLKSSQTLLHHTRFFLAPTSFTRPEVFWKQWINLLS